MIEAQYDKNEALVKKFLKKEGKSLKRSSHKVRKYLQIDWYIGTVPVKFEIFKTIGKQVPFQGVDGKELGWFKRSRARWMVLYVEDDKKLYIIDVPGVRRYVRETIREEKRKMVDGYYRIDLDILRSQKLIRDEFSLGTVKKPKPVKKTKTPVKKSTTKKKKGEGNGGRKRTSTSNG